MTIYKGWNATLYYGQLTPYTQIGYAESASVEITSNVEPWFSLGSRITTDIAEGNEEITGSLSKAWIDKGYLMMLTGAAGLTEFNLCFTVSTAMKLYCYNCKFSRGSIDIPQDGFLKEDYDFIPKSIAVV